MVKAGSRSGARKRVLPGVDPKIGTAPTARFCRERRVSPHVFSNSGALNFADATDLGGHFSAPSTTSMTTTTTTNPRAVPTGPPADRVTKPTMVSPTDPPTLPTRTLPPD